MLPPLLFLPAALLLHTLNDVPQAQYPEGSSRICQHATEKNSGELEVEGKHLVLFLGTVDSQINGRRARHGDAAPRRDGQTDEIAVIPAAERRLNGNEKEMGLVKEKDACSLRAR